MYEKFIVQFNEKRQRVQKVPYLFRKVINYKNRRKT